MPIIPFGDFDRFFADDDVFLPSLRRVKAMHPALDLYEEGNTLVAEINLPDIKPENVEISVKNDVLTVNGVKEEKEETEEKGYWRKEIRRGSFERQVTLPAQVDEDKVNVAYEKGVLKIMMPKSEEKETGKKIEIEVR